MGLGEPLLQDDLRVIWFALLRKIPKRSLFATVEPRLIIMVCSDLPPGFVQDRGQSAGLGSAHDESDGRPYLILACCPPVPAVASVAGFLELERGTLRSRDPEGNMRVGCRQCQIYPVKHIGLETCSEREVIHI